MLSSGSSKCDAAASRESRIARAGPGRRGRRVRCLTIAREGRSCADGLYRMATGRSDKVAAYRVRTARAQRAITVCPPLGTITDRCRVFTFHICANDRFCDVQQLVITRRAACRKRIRGLTAMRVRLPQLAPRITNAHGETPYGKGRHFPAHFASVVAILAAFAIAAPFASQAAQSSQQARHRRVQAGDRRERSRGYRDAGRQIKRTLSEVNAVAVVLPRTAVAKLRQNKRVKYVEDDNLQYMLTHAGA